MELFKLNNFHSNEDIADQISVINEEIHQKQNYSKKKIWTNKAQFIFTSIGYTFGLTNIWRFPYLTYENGGGTFQMAYVILLILVGIPIYLTETVIGQFSSQGAIGIWKCCPIGQGIGWAMIISIFIARCHNNVLLAYTLIYLASSFTSQLPWQQCEEWWGADQHCYVRNSSSQMKFNSSRNSSVTDSIKKEIATKQYWERFVLNINSSEGVYKFTTLEWKIVTGLVIIMVCLYFSIFKGIRSIGKVSYFTAIFPFVILLAFLIQSVMLDGATTGLYYFFVPSWEKFLDFKIWMNAARQVIFSLGAGSGVLINLSSHNHFHNNFYKNSIIIGVIDYTTSVLGSVVVFSVVGMLAKDVSVPISEVFTGGQGLAYITFPEATTKLPTPQFWCFAFFLMLFVVGIGSSITAFETVLAALMDKYPFLHTHKKQFHIISICLLFCAGLPFTSAGGHYFLILFDNYTVFSRSTIAMIEVIFIMWIYGSQRFCENIKLMIGNYPNQYLRVCWTFITPLVCIGLNIMSFMNFTLPKYGKYVYPIWAHAIGWIYVSINLGQIPLWMLIVFYKHWKKGKLCGALKSTADWGPSLNDEIKSTQRIFNSTPVMELTKL